MKVAIIPYFLIPITYNSCPPLICSPDINRLNITLKFHLTLVISQLEIKQYGIHYRDEINLDEHSELLTQ